MASVINNFIQIIILLIGNFIVRDVVTRSHTIAEIEPDCLRRVAVNITINAQNLLSHHALVIFAIQLFQAGAVFNVSVLRNAYAMSGRLVIEIT